MTSAASSVIFLAYPDTNNLLQIYFFVMLNREAFEATGFLTSVTQNMMRSQREVGSKIEHALSTV